MEEREKEEKAAESEGKKERTGSRRQGGGRRARAAGNRLVGSRQSRWKIHLRRRGAASSRSM
jgi:hypothetical protein